MNTTTVRLLLFVAVFLSIVFLPWWLSLLVMVSLAYYFPLYIEIIFFGFIFDSLFLASYKFPYVSLIATAVILVLIISIRKHIRR
jgi:hypothetical protein